MILCDLGSHTLNSSPQATKAILYILALQARGVGIFLKARHVVLCHDTQRGSSVVRQGHRSDSVHAIANIGRTPLQPPDQEPSLSPLMIEIFHRRGEDE